MKLGETGEAFFVEEVEEGDSVSPLLGTSPLPPSVLHNYQGTTKDFECQRHDSGIDDSSASVPKNMNDGIIPLSDGMEGEETQTHQRTVVLKTKTKDEDLELGVIKKVKKSVEKDVKSSFAQTDGPFKLSDTPKKGVKESATLKSPHKSGKNDNAASRHGSLLTEAHGSKTDGEETVKGSCCCYSKLVHLTTKIFGS